MTDCGITMGLEEKIKMKVSRRVLSACRGKLSNSVQLKFNENNREGSTSIPSPEEWERLFNFYCDNNNYISTYK